MVHLYVAEMILYEGEAFTIEWYHSANGKSQALEFYKELDRDRRIQLLKMVKLMGDAGQIRNKTKFRNEGDKIFAFKPKPDRFLCFFSIGKKIIITNAFTKKADKLPKREKERALRHMQDYIDRVKKETYYEQE